MHPSLRTMAKGLLPILAMGTTTAASTEPCGQISDLYAQNNDSTTIVSASLALDCLMSMPFDQNAAAIWIDEFSKYMQFQSDLELLQSPPATYLSPKVDLLGGLEEIQAYAIQGIYQSQYEFDSAVLDLLNSANDGHLYIDLCSLSSFTFLSTMEGLSSLSVDGISTPQLYTLGDAKLLSEGVAASVSPVIYINGVNAVSSVVAESIPIDLQDPDARYNNIVTNLLYTGQGTEIGGVFTQDTVWRGIDSYNLTFANGTSASYKMEALLTGPFAYTDGNDFYNSVCNNTAINLAAASATASATSTPTSTGTSTSSAAGSPPPSLYPTPVMREPYNTIVGYYPDDEGLEDVAVLSVPTFETSGDGLPDSTLVDFAVVAEYFVQNASTVDGKKKIIIDMQTNPGGDVISAYALYSVFFPNETLYSATRFRSHEAMDFIGTIYNAQNNTDNEIVQESGLYIDGIVKPDQTSTFNSWEDLFGPYKVGGIPSSAMMAEFDFADDVDPTEDPVNTDGLGGVLDAKTPPFAPEDILILTDGRCSSSCTIFGDHMVSKGVKTVAVGGRPLPGPMQLIGGIKGSEVMELTSLDVAAQEAVALLNSSIASGNPILSQENITRFYEVIPIPLEDFPFPISTAAVNFLNTYTTDDDDVPTQYLYEAANCHVFYTPETLLKPSATWALAANATWGSLGCVGGVENTTTLGSYDPNSSGADSTKSHKALGLLLALGAGMS